MKKILLTILLALGIWSCGSVKKSSNETDLKTDSSSGSQKEWNLNWGNYSLKPFDPNKPMIFTNAQGKRDTLVNTIIEHHYNTEYVKVKDTANVKTDLKQDIEVKEKDYSQVIEKLANRFILLIVILFVLYFILSYLKNKTPLI